MKQGESEDIIDYMYVFKSKRNIMLGIIGNMMLDGFFENSAEFKRIPAISTVEQDRLKKDLRLWFIAVLFLQNLDQNQFDDMLLYYWKPYSNKYSRYPASIPYMVDVMHQQPENKKKQKTPNHSPKDKYKKEDR